MTRIHKSDKDWLIKNGYLKIVKGKYVGLIVCNKNHNSNSKTYYVEDRFAKLLNKKYNKNYNNYKHTNNKHNNKYATKK